MVSLFEGEFFPRWLQYLLYWLQASVVPDFEEVTNWYLGWKSQFPESLLEDAVIVSCFSQALEICNYALTCQAGAGLPIPPGVAENMSYFRVVERRNVEAAAARRLKEIQSQGQHDSGPGGGRAPGSTVGISFKEVVEKFAEDNGVIFMPREGRMHEGKQVWQFGTRLCIIDQNVVFVHQAYDAIGGGKNHWTPIGLEELLAICR